MRALSASAALLLCNCATPAELAVRPPDHIYQSARSAEAVADCLLDRVSSGETRSSRENAAGAVRVTFTVLGGLARPRPILYMFTIRGRDGGSLIEAYRLGKADLRTAETCF